VTIFAVNILPTKVKMTLRAFLTWPHLRSLSSISSALCIVLMIWPVRKVILTLLTPLRTNQGIAPLQGLCSNSFLCAIENITMC
jgi:hypothetical protein